MATKSITKSVEITGQENARRFAEAMEQATESEKAGLDRMICMMLCLRKHKRMFTDRETFTKGEKRMNVYEARKKGREYCQTEGSDHYKDGGLEPMDLIIAKGLAEDFCISNMIKYAVRFKKTRNLKDLAKVADYAHILCGIEGG